MTPHQLHYDTIVIGARPAGAATALLLARAGQRVLVVDRSAPGDDALSTHALMRPAVLLLHRWGVLDAIAGAGTPAIRTSTFHYGDTALPVAIKPRDGISALYAPRRTVLDPALVAAARAAGAEVHHHAKLRALVRGAGCRVTGAVIDFAGTTATVTADLVIGADGLGSTVARQVSAEVLREAPHATATIYTHVPAGDDSYHWYYREGASAGIVPTNGGACVFLVVPPARYRALRDDLPRGFRALLGELVPARAEHDVPPLRSFAGRPGYLRRATGPGWALVGDAGFFRDPFTAHGLTDALLDAALLADAVIAGDPGRYAAARDAHALPMLEVTDAIASFAWTLGELGELHRRLQRELAREAELVLAMSAAREQRPVVELEDDPRVLGARHQRRDAGQLVGGDVLDPGQPQPQRADVAAAR